MLKNARSERIIQLTFYLVQIQSDTGTRQEKDVEDYLHKWLAKLDYYKNHPKYYPPHRA